MLNVKVNYVSVLLINLLGGINTLGILMNWGKFGDMMIFIQINCTREIQTKKKNGSICSFKTKFVKLSHYLQMFI